MQSGVENLARHFAPFFSVHRPITPRKILILSSLARCIYYTKFYLNPPLPPKNAPLSHFFRGDARKAAEPESIRQPAQRRRKKRQRPDFDAPVFRLSALARVIRTQAAKKKGRKIDVDPAFPPEIRGVSDADLASTSAESPSAQRPCVHQFKNRDKGDHRYL